jgi:hypothetical protein
LADGTNDYVLYDNPDGSMVGKEVSFQYRYEGEFGEGLWGATDVDGYRYDIYQATETRFYVFVSDTGSGNSEYWNFDVSALSAGQVYSIKAKWTADNTAPQFWLDGEEIATVGQQGTVTLSTALSKYYLYTIGSTMGTSYFGKAGISDIQVKRTSDGKFLHSWHCDEGSGTTSYDSVETWYGGELVTNGDFATDSGGWSGLTWNAGQYAVSSSATITQSNVLEFGKTYEGIIRIKRISGSDSAIRFGGGDSASSALLPVTDEWVTHNVTFTQKYAAYPRHLYVYSTVAGELAIDNISVKELHEPSHGEIKNATESTFHVTDPSFKSYQNEVGYSQSIISDGTDDYIDTGIVADDTTEFEVFGKFNNTSDQVIGAGVSNTAYDRFGFGIYGGEWLLNYGIGAHLTVGTPDTDLHKFKITNSGKFFIDDIEVNSTEQVLAGNGKNIALLGMNREDNTKSLFANFEMHYAKIWQDGKLVRHFVPRADGTMFDLVNEKSYSNDGTGDLSLGIPVPVAHDRHGNATKKDIYGNNATYLGRTRNKTVLAGTNVGKFDGANAYVELSEALEDTVWSVEWRLTDYIETPGDFDFIFGGAGDKNIAMRSASQQKIAFRASDSNYSYFDYVSSAENINNKVLKLVSNGTDIKLYVEGDLVDTVTPTDTTFVFRDIMRGYGSNAYSIEGELDYVEYTNSNKTYRYDFGEGAGDIVYDRVPATTPVDKIVNGNMELETGWTVYNNPTSSQGRSDDVAYSGNYSWKVMSQGGSRGTNQLITGLVPGEKVDLEVWYYNASGAAYVRTFNGSDNSTQITNSGSLNILGAWTKYSVTFTVPSGETSVYVRLTDFGTPGTYYFDDVIFNTYFDPINGTVTNATSAEFWETSVDVPDTNVTEGYTAGLFFDVAGNKVALDKQVILDTTKKFTIQGSGYLEGGVDYRHILSDAGGANGTSRLGWNGSATRFTNNGGDIYSFGTVNFYNYQGQYVDWKIVNNGDDTATLTINGDSQTVTNTSFKNSSFNFNNFGGIRTATTTWTAYEGWMGDIIILDENNKRIHQFEVNGSSGKPLYDPIGKITGTMQDVELRNYPAQLGNTGKDVFGGDLSHVPDDMRHSSFAYKTVGKFDGVNDEINCGTDEKFNIRDKITMSAWVNLDSYTAGGVHTDRGVIMIKPYAYYMTITSATGKLASYFYGVDPNHRDSNAQVPLNEWTHVSLTYDGTAIKYYINGVLDKTYADTGTIDERLASQFSIGREIYNDYGRAIDGKISDVRLYNRALSDDEIMQLYNKENVTAGLVAHYPLSEGAGETVYDARGDVYGENMVTTPFELHEGHPYDVFTGVSKTGFYAEKTQTGAIYGIAGVTNFPITAGEKYKVSFDLTVNSGEDPFVFLGTAIGGNLIAGTIDSQHSTGYHEIIYSPTGSDATASFQFHNSVAALSNIEVKNFKIQKLIPAANGTITGTTPAEFWDIDNTLPASQAHENGFSQALVNTTAGTAYTPSNVAHGEWEFDFELNDTTDYLDVEFITDDVVGIESGFTGCALRLGSRFYLNCRNAGVTTDGFYTDTNYLEANKNYRVKVTRSATNEFNVYMKGDGKIGAAYPNGSDEYVLVDPTGGGGTNPVTITSYTTSRYVVTDMDPGDEIANLKINGHSVALHEFTPGTGKYEKKFLPVVSGQGTDVLGSVLHLLGINSASNFSGTDLALLGLKKLAEVGKTYWDATARKFLIGRSDGSLGDAPTSTDEMKTTTELNTMNTNTTAEEGVFYWDTQLRRFWRGNKDGNIQNFMDWFGAQ